MEELLEVFPALIILVVSIAASVAGNQKKQRREAAKRARAFNRTFQVGGASAGPVAPGAPAASDAPVMVAASDAPVTVAAPMAKPLDRPPLAPRVSAMQAESLAGEAEIMPGADEVYQPAQTQVHDHLAPACPAHEADGSLEYASPEGVDPCHAEDLRGMNTPLPPRSPAAPAPSGFHLKLDAEDLTQAFVLQEILKRPRERRRRC